MSSEFQALLLEGVFYLSDELCVDSHGKSREGWNKLMVSTPEGVLDVYDQLRPYVGQRVQLAVHHVPANPPDPTRWGGGCCLWEPHGVCLFGHHDRPMELYNVSGQGILVYDLDHSKSEGGWWLAHFDGSRTPLLLGHVLPGHQARVAAATLFDVEAMREKLVSSGGLDQVDALGSKVTELRDLVERLTQAIQEDE
jgi:hypothetical protein